MHQAYITTVKIIKKLQNGEQANYNQNQRGS